MADTTIEAPVVDQTPVPVEPAPQTPISPASGLNDPFQLDEVSLASLTPEQRASLNPLIDTWKKKAEEEISRREQEVSKKYKPFEEKAQALEKLTNYQPFVQWWTEQQKQAMQGTTSTQAQQISQSNPQQFATPEEWQNAVWEASQGNPAKLQEIQQRMMSTWATPLFQQLNQKQQYIETQMEVKDLFERHPDAKELDKIGVDAKTGEGVSILEMGLDWAERNKKPLEEGYAMAKRWADSMRVGAQQQAMGLVNSKKQEVTASNSTQTSNGNVVTVENADELVRRSLEAQISGNKDVRFVIKGR